MANLAISAVCNQQCAYCFTVDHLPRGRGTGKGRRDVRPRPQAEEQFLPVHAFQERLDFLQRSGIQEVRLLGGEPTLHPHFAALVEQARAVGMSVVVFTNGLMPEQALACLEALSPDQCAVMVNVSQPVGNGRDDSYQRRRDTLLRLGNRAMSGFTIYRPDFQPGFLLTLITETGCKPVIRLGMAQPCLSGDNQYIHPSQYRAVATRIVRFARVAAGAGVTLDLDCGFVRCMFSDDDLGALRVAEAKVGWRCNPILDVDLQGDVLHCYPLSRLARLALTPESDAVTLRQAFEDRTRPYRQAGVYKECSTCPLKAAGECSGGCLAMTIRRFRHTSFHLRVPVEVAA